jgi:hypothetical protein
MNETVQKPRRQTREPLIRIVRNENIARGRYLSQSRNIAELGVPAIEVIDRIYRRGLALGDFRAGLDPVDIHALRKEVRGQLARVCE